MNKKNSPVEESKKSRRKFYVAGMSRAWLVVVTNNGKEGLVLPQLTRQGYEVYRPMCHVTVTHNWEKVIKARPLFPNYLFVQKQGEMYERISGMLGVAWIYPTMLLNSVIDRMKSKEQDNFLEIVASLNPKYGQPAVGDRVKTLDGLIEVVLTETSDIARVSALSGFMNGNSRMTLDMSRLADGKK
ncbi:hypothetical protein AEAC466_17315 [Asticcacaulis sp. AC466]|uniref:transcription termination/antitermination NusG family protein n=1 Tax=Asticcacaulis sp. AC466 TaxID=1282362 RepID=UPI0003C3AC03|nr:transcription termination/antitermination NusG family protein [Asticcacaulis sp. AC466]ESQ82382.1 hypothetical protein AEAC466_17315 [Asticcacaulis sp. AC466]